MTFITMAECLEGGTKSSLPVLEWLGRATGWASHQSRWVMDVRSVNEGIISHSFSGSRDILFSVMAGARGSPGCSQASYRAGIFAVHFPDRELQRFSLTASFEHTRDVGSTSSSGLFVGARHWEHLEPSLLIQALESLFEASKIFVRLIQPQDRQVISPSTSVPLQLGRVKVT